MRTLLFALVVCGLVAIVVLRSQRNKSSTSDVLKEYSTAIEEVLAQPKGSEIIFALQQKIDQKWARDGLASLTAAEKVFLCVDGIETEVNNGGFHQYFFNSAGDFALDVPAAFRAISANHTGEIVSRACSVFPISQPPRNRQERQQLLDRIDEEREQLLDKLDGEFYAYEDNLQ